MTEATNTARDVRVMARCVQTTFSQIENGVSVQFARMIQRNDEGAIVHEFAVRVDSAAAFVAGHDYVLRFTDHGKADEPLPMIHHG